MDYTVVGFFSDQDDADRASNKLRDVGVPDSDIDLSPFSTQGEYTGDDYEYEEEEDTKGFWESLFGDDDDDHDRRRHSRVGARSHVVTVHATDRVQADMAVEILDGCGALDVRERDQMISSGQNMGTDLDRGPNPDVDNDGNDTISVIKENLEVGKREVETGGARIRSRIVERPVEQHVRLRKERVYVTRRPVDREISPAEAENFKEETIEMKEHAERAVVKKTAHVVEEISIHKDVEQEDETIRETVRETEVDIDDDSTPDEIRDRDIDLRKRNDDRDVNI